MIKLGDYVRTIKGAEFWGIVIALDSDNAAPAAQ